MVTHCAGMYNKIADLIFRAKHMDESTPCIDSITQGIKELYIQFHGVR